MTNVNTGWFKKSSPPSDFSYGPTWPAQALWAHVHYQKIENGHSCMYLKLIFLYFEVKNAIIAMTKVHTGWFKKSSPPSDFSYGPTWPSQGLWAYGLL